MDLYVRGLNIGRESFYNARINIGRTDISVRLYSTVTIVQECRYSIVGLLQVHSGSGQTAWAIRFAAGRLITRSARLSRGVGSILMITNFAPAYFA